MKKIKQNQRGRKISVYPWALELGKEIVSKTMFCGMVMDETDLALYWAQAITETFDDQ